jgi:arsenate reductase-like glutaredoxin family protein
MFEDNIMATYLKAHGLDYEVIRFGKKPSEIKHLINVYEDTLRGKLNETGSKESALSSTNCKQTAVKDTLSANLDNYIRNKAKCKKSDLLWTCFKDCKTRVQKNGVNNYSNEWLPMNTKATNNYGDRHTVAYLLNLYPNPELVKASSARGFSVKEDVYAISEMVQFIWRSAIRNNEEINLYIPSKRMRTFLKNWLEDKYEISK